MNLRAQENRRLMEEGVLPWPSPEQIKRRRTGAGGWKAWVLAEWGVCWPPPHGWRRELVEGYRLQRLDQRAKDAVAASANQALDAEFREISS